MYYLKLEPHFYTYNYAKMSYKLLKDQPQKRKNVIERLYTYLSNPGRFSILILGDRGTGKTFWVEQFAEAEKLNLIIRRARLTEEKEEYWEQLLKDSNKGILLIKDIELLSAKSQELLFEAMSTKDGNFGLKVKKYEVRIVFTSSKSVSLLRDSNRYLSSYFFDRIAQLVVEFPNFANCSNKVVEDFKFTWEKFQFPSKYPEILEQWLKENAHTLNGNFRDLDKICINWDNLFRSLKRSGSLIEEGLKNIKSQVIEDFKTYNHFPEVKESAVYEIYFEDKKYEDLKDEFKFKLRTWAKEKYGSLRKAGEALGVSPRTMERW